MFCIYFLYIVKKISTCIQVDTINNRYFIVYTKTIYPPQTLYFFVYTKTIYKNYISATNSIYRYQSIHRV